MTGNVPILVIWEDLGNAAKISSLLASASPGTCHVAQVGAVLDDCMLHVADIAINNIGADEVVNAQEHGQHLKSTLR